MPTRAKTRWKLVAAHRQTAWKLPRYTKDFLADMAALRYRATVHPVPCDRSSANRSVHCRYREERVRATLGWYLFDTSKQPDYGYLARLDRPASKRAEARRPWREEKAQPILRCGNSCAE
jgi:hypothetical protein